VKLENSFEVPGPPDAAWALLNDVPRIIPCMPGAELNETVDESTWKATMRVKLGPISLTFATDVKREEADDAAHRAKLSAKARETKGRGQGRATIESTLTPVDGGTRVDIVTDLVLSGPVAQYGRGMVQDVSSQMVNSFAECLKAQLGSTPEEAEVAIAAQAKPISGLSLGLKAFGRAIRRLFRRRA
jgi:carbon monoxide dehydrogenase subunit G